MVSAFNLSDEFFEADDDQLDLEVSIEEALEVANMRPVISVPGIGSRVPFTYSEK